MGGRGGGARDRRGPPRGGGGAGLPLPTPPPKASAWGACAPSAFLLLFQRATEGLLGARERGEGGEEGMVRAKPQDAALKAAAAALEARVPPVVRH